jgi:hypothetical protein
MFGRQAFKLDASFRARRRIAAAFLTGAALFVCAAAAIVSQGAFARGALTVFGAGGLRFPSNFDVDLDPNYVKIPLAPAPARAAPKPGNVSARVPRPRAVCVRLCDGFYFPLDTPTAYAADAACASLCPDAPTASYTLPGGSDRIDDAVSTSGERYRALPVRLRYRATRDKTCICHRSVASDLSPLLDPTLRKGDAVMTERGFAVFQGAEQPTHGPADFVALSAVALPRDQRVALLALERGNAMPARGVTRSWTLAQGPRWSVRRARALFATATTGPRPGSPGSTRNEIRFLEPPTN